MRLKNKEDVMAGEVKHYPFYINGVKQVYPNVSAGTPKYASAVVVDNLVFVSGMTAQETDTGDCQTNTVRDQMNVCLTKLKTALEEVGSSMDNIVKTLIFLKDVKDYPVMRATELEFYRKHAPRLVEEPPASTFLQPAALARPEFLVEIEAVAVVKRK
jgi:2-iminobutanoate/2-iminopropanoate deaminase